VLFLLLATTLAIALEPRRNHVVRRVRTEGRDNGKKRTDQTEAGAGPRANALKLVSQQHYKQIVGIESAGEALAGEALGAGLLP
jgi:hypothetical protein